MTNDEITMVQGIENAPAAAKLREEVFLQEQGFSTEFDEIDPIAWHLTLTRGGETLAVGRLYPAPEEPGLYLDLTSQLPLEVAAAWLGEEAALERDVRSMALTCEEEDAVLYLRSEAGEVFRYATALPASAVREVCAGLSPNGSTFAYESDDAPLAR